MHPPPSGTAAFCADKTQWFHGVCSGEHGAQLSTVSPSVAEAASLETIYYSPPPLTATHRASIMPHQVIKVRVTHPNGKFDHFIVINSPKDSMLLGNDFGEQVGLVVMEGPCIFFKCPQTLSSQPQMCLPSCMT